ncbi:MAG TPA: beta-L-arabinofuranosidase domain-containing protein [Terracidiphilus sp.]|nr:beta-L-arabinofuranosidase domain-containing protein [Terracidiphilus sp.]
MKTALTTAPFTQQLLRAAQPMASVAGKGNPMEPKNVIEAFNYDGVSLLDGMLKKQYTMGRDYYFNLSNDDILIGFRRRAGLPAPGKDLGGWISGDPKVISWWSKGDVSGTFGQWLSAMARMSKAAGDDAIGNKAVYLMLEWAKTIEPDGFFYYSRNPWAPHYTYDKTVCGLVDMAEYCGRKDALPLLEKITDWAIANLDRSRGLDQDPGTEWFTLSENLYRAYQLTGNPKYRNFGDVWRYTAYWDSFIGGKEMTPYNHHAYSHVNTLGSAAMTYAVTGDPKYLKCIVNAYDWLEKTQFYATGGYGPNERLVPDDGSLGNYLETTIRSYETPCGTWAAFKFARYLMQFTGEAKYGDWIERLAYNGIGAALPMAANGRTFYYSDYQIGAGRKTYYPDGAWPCCSGTFPQVLADYHNVIYFKDPESLYVNLFVPSEVRWNHDGQDVKVQQLTAFPESDTSTISINPRAKTTFNLKIRVPRWSRGATIKINGAAQDIACQPGTWATVSRSWMPGDTVTIQVPMRLTFEPVDKQHPNRVAVMYGPVVLVRNQTPILIPKGDNESNWIVENGQSLEFKAAAQPLGNFTPFYQVGEGTPYNMYFDLKT